MAFSGNQITRIGLSGVQRAAYPGFTAKAPAEVTPSPTGLEWALSEQADWILPTRRGDWLLRVLSMGMMPA